VTFYFFSGISIKVSGVDVGFVTRVLTSIFRETRPSLELKPAIPVQKAGFTRDRDHNADASNRGVGCVEWRGQDDCGSWSDARAKRCRTSRAGVLLGSFFGMQDVQVSFCVFLECWGCVRGV